MKKTLFIALFCLILTPVFVGAQVIGPTPSQVAIAVCNGKGSGEVCTFRGAQNETVSGTCNNLPGGVFACKPTGGIPQTKDIAPVVTAYTSNENTSMVQNTAMAEKLSGFILLQVEANGEAWYIYPDNNQRYYLGRPDDAFKLMRDLGLGIAHSELNSYLTTGFPGRLSGYIMLDVESNGEAYYVYPKNLKGYYLGRPDDAFSVMRNLGLGISNYDLDSIAVSDSSAIIENSSSKDNASNQVDNSISGDITETKVVDTNQTTCSNAISKISCPAEGSSFYGQDANYSGVQASYTDNEDGTITDNNTGLMWIKDAGDKTAYYNGVNSADLFSYAGYSDWRVPTIKELYSLMDFSGVDIDPTVRSASTPFINDGVFTFEYGDIGSGDRIIDSQWITSNIYVSDVMNGQECFFGVNFADGRIKCYPTADNGHNNGYFLRFVRGVSEYGENHYIDNGDATVTDKSSSLMWMQDDSGVGMDWEDALAYCENSTLAGHSDWRLPDAKELQYIVDYTRSPDTTDSPALDSIFNSTQIIDEMGKKDWGFYWTSTTHKSANGYDSAVYIGFGECIGEMNGEVMDVHGAGCQRSDPKTGIESDYPSLGNGPQGDARRVFNYVRCVR